MRNAHCTVYTLMNRRQTIRIRAWQQSCNSIKRNMSLAQILTDLVSGTRQIHYCHTSNAYAISRADQINRFNQNVIILLVASCFFSLQIEIYKLWENTCNVYPKCIFPLNWISKVNSIWGKKRYVFKQRKRFFKFKLILIDILMENHFGLIPIFVFIQMNNKIQWKHAVNCKIFAFICHFYGFDSNDITWFRYYSMSTITNYHQTHHIGIRPNCLTNNKFRSLKST